jgi:hypothetical protein
MGDVHLINRRYLALIENRAETQALARKILEEGGVALPDFFDQETTDRLMAYSRSLRPDNRYSITWLSGTPAMDVARSSEFMRFFDAIHQARCGILGEAYCPLDPSWQAVSLPVKTPESGRDQTPFHFDDSFINAVFAMKMPTISSEGNLMVYPNLRLRVKPLTLSRIIARALRHVSLARMFFRPREVSYVQGGLHVFFGDLTLHGVPALTHGERITLTINASRQPPPSCR